jgi:anti-anti-sigma regulatory factor
MEVSQRGEVCTVALAGCLKAAQAHELRQVCGAARGHLRIDLSDLLSVDAVGIDALRRLRRDGAELLGVPRYLRRWLA